MEPYIILAIIAMFAYGVTAILYKIAPKIDAVSLTLFSSLSLTIFTFIAWLFTKKEISLKGIGVASAAGLIAAIAFISYIMAIKSGKVGIAATLRSLSFGVTILLAILLLGEKITLVKALGIGFAVIAVILLSL